MKKKRDKIIHIINWGLLFSMPIMLLTVKVNTDVICSSSDIKKLSTSLLFKVDDSKASVKEEKEDEKIEEVEESEDVDIEPLKPVEKKTSPEIVEEKKEEPVVVPSPSNSSTTYTGNMSFYYADCYKCSGITAAEVDVSDGRIYYQDSEYGSVRIVAAGKEIPKWSILRIKNSSLGNDILAIVLDRGGDIGIGKTFLIDVLTNHVEKKGGINKNITVEVLRSGK